MYRHLKKHEETIPIYFDAAITKLEADAVDDTLDIPKKQRMILQKWNGELKNYIRMDIYGFNSGESSTLYSLVMNH